MPEETRKEELIFSNFDILTLLTITKQNNWKSLRETSLGRIIYLASVLYKFMFPDNKNIFSDNYTFSFDETGPYSDVIRKSLLHLETNEFIERDGLNLKLSDSKKVNKPISEEENLRKKWLEIIMNLLSSYGEGKVYDFVIRDPLYQDSFKRNTPKNIQIDYDNLTLKNLNSFKDTFEKSLGDKSQKITPNKYLELYFEFIFGKVLRGEIDV